MKQATLSLIRHALTAAGAALVAKGIVSEQAAGELAGIVMALVGALWGVLDEYLAERAAKKAAPASVPPVVPLLACTLLLGALCTFSGCRTLAPNGAYNGDNALYSADKVITTAYDVLDTFVTWERQNEALLASQPEISRSANHVRANAKRWIQSAIAVRETYAAAPTPENRRSLEQALAILNAVLTEVTQYMAQAGPPVVAPKPETQPST